MAVLPREFCNFTHDFCGLAPMCIVGHVRRSQQKTVHAEPCEAMPLQQGGHWVGENRSHDILKKGVFKRLVFDTWKSCKLPNDIVKDEATVDVLGMCIYASPLPTAIQISLLALCWEGSVIFISAWALALLVQQYRAMQEPPSVGRATERFPRFFFMPSVYLLTRTSAHGNSGHKRKN